MEYELSAESDARAEIKAALDFNGFAYDERDDGFYAVFSEGACKWNAALRAQGGVAVILAAYPFDVDESAGLRVCAEINSRLLFGAAFPEGGRLIVRVSADLFDGYMAYEAIGRALEYSAGVMVAFWEQAACAAEVEGLRSRSKD